MINYTESTGFTLNTSNEIVLLPFLHYIECTTDDSTIDMALDFSIINSSYYSASISTTSNMHIKYAGVSRVLFDKTIMEAGGVNSFYYGIASGSNSNSFTGTIPPDIVP